MVDRITPATARRIAPLVADMTGFEDAWPVVAEPFRQWVIEDHFPLGRPRWEDVGALMVADVASLRDDEAALPERRAFDAGLSLGSPPDVETIADAMADAEFRRTSSAACGARI